jgi:hypothetical protein
VSKQPNDENGTACRQIAPSRPIAPAERQLHLHPLHAMHGQQRRRRQKRQRANRGGAEGARCAAQ